MNYQKIDASLSAALKSKMSSEEPNLIVFVRTIEIPNHQQIDELSALGIHDVSSNRKIFSAQVSPRVVSELTNKPWVRLVSLSQQLKPLK